MNLRRCLDQCSLGLLKQIAAAHAVPLPDPAARGELIGALVGRLLGPGYLATYVAHLDEAARAVLGRVAAEGGQARGFLLERESQGPGGDDGREGSRELLARLAGSGLLFRVFQASGTERGELYVLPGELTPLLPATRPPASRLVPVAGPAEVHACAPTFIMFALASFLRRWQEQSGHRTEAGGQLPALEQETTELVVELPSRSARERWTLFAHLAVRLGLLRRDAGGLALTDAFEEWLGRRGEAAHRLWAAYLGSERWNDLERAGSGAARFAGRTSEPRAARASVLGVIGSLPLGTWLLAAHVERAIRAQAPDFLREGFDAATSRLMDLASGEVLAGAPSWERVERAMIEYMLGGPLYWLGSVEWGQGPEGWDRLRLTERAGLWLAGSDSAFDAAPERLELSADGRLVAPATCDLALLWQLEPYLALERRGPPSVYSLSRASFSRGLAAGGSSHAVRELLERATAGPLPAAVRSELARWDGQAGRFVLRPLVALLAQDEAELTEALRRLEGSDLVGERLGPRAATVSRGRAPELAAALEQLGHLPDLDAALRPLAGRRAFAALVDQEVLEALLFCIRLARSLDPALAAEIPHAERLLRRLEQALGPITATRSGRRARALARRLRGPPPGQPRRTGGDVAGASGEAV